MQALSLNYAWLEKPIQLVSNLTCIAGDDGFKGDEAKPSAVPEVWQIRIVVFSHETVCWECFFISSINNKVTLFSVSEVMGMLMFCNIGSVLYLAAMRYQCSQGGSLVDWELLHYMSNCGSLS